MNGILSLVFCAQFLVALLLIPAVCTNANGTASDTSTMTNATTNNSLSGRTMTIRATTTSHSGSTPTSGAATTTTTKSIPTSKSTATTTPSTFFDLFTMEKCFPLLHVAAGLIIVCIILLTSTLLLACKVCRLSRRLKTLSSNGDMISNTEYWMGTDKEDKNKPEARETTVLMTDITQTQEEMSNGAAKEEEGKAKEDGQAAEEKEEGEAAVSEEASATPPVADSSSSPKPQEEAPKSEPSNAAAATASSEGKEEPKDGQ